MASSPDPRRGTVFSNRVPAPSGSNRLTAALAARTGPYIDLTVSNPTLVGLTPSRAGVSSGLELLADPRGERYHPDPRGLLVSREAISAYYQRRGVIAEPERILLTASTSEAYGFLFKLLADPGDAVLVPAPSYPLLDALAELEAVVLHRYPLTPEDGWGSHASHVESRVLQLAEQGRRVAVVVLVNPNNPTGGSVSMKELRTLLELSRRHGFAVISDEVFLDYRFEQRSGDVAVAAAEAGGLVFSLGGLSKAAALPQLKLGWIVANGPQPELSNALARLEWIADAYLSVGSPVQLALPQLLIDGEKTAALLRRRIEENFSILATRFPPGGAVSVNPLSGGWSAVLRLPALVPEEDLVLSLLHEHALLVHPGYFFEFPFEAFLVVSLLSPTDEFDRGTARLAHALAGLLR